MIAAFDVRFDAPLRGPVVLAASVGTAGAAQRVEAGRDRATVVVEVAEPELWWPRGLGGQRLYDARSRSPRPPAGTPGASGSASARCGWTPPRTPTARRS